MVEETGTVVEIRSNSIVVEVLKTSACQSCKAKQGCGQAVLSEWGHSDKQAQKNHFDIPTTQEANVGDRVVLGLPEDAVSSAAFLVYIVPLIVSFIALILTQRFVESEGVQLVVMTLAFGLTFLVLRAISSRNQAQFVPEILRLSTPSQGPEILASTR